MPTEAPTPNQTTPELQQMSDLLKTARLEVETHARSHRRSPRVDDIEGIGAMVVSISPKQEIVAHPYDPDHDASSYERATGGTEEATLLANIDAITQAHSGYRRAYLAPTIVDDREERPLYLERDVA